MFFGSHESTAIHQRQQGVMAVLAGAPPPLQYILYAVGSNMLMLKSRNAVEAIRFVYGHDEEDEEEEVADARA